MSAARVNGRWTAALLSVVTMAAIASDECDHTDELTAELPLEGITRVVIDAKAGWLKVLGSPSQKTVSAHGIACAPSKRILDEIKLEARRSGQTAYITAEVPTDMWSPLDWLAGEGWRYLNLTVRLPSNLTVEVKDSSGSLEVRNTGDTSIDDSSGSIRATDINGDLAIKDGSGSILVESVRGDVHVKDGSGSIRVQGAGGDVTVADGSGSIAIADVGKDVVIQRDGSGSISVTDVGGSFTVERDGSGSVSHDGVKGAIRIDD